MKTAQQAAEAWVASAAKANTNWQAGVQSTNADWAGRTTAQQATMLNNLTQAITGGRWANGVNRKGTAGWKNDTIAKQQNYSTGFQAGAQRQQAAIAKIIQAEQTINQGLTPRGDFNANVQRSVQVQTQLHALKGTLGA